MDFNPVKLVNEAVVIIIVVIALAGVWRYRDRVLAALTGDDKIHGGILDCIWNSCFLCCGTCTGDWTRCFTECQLCPARYRKRNLVRLVGQWLGLTTHTVEMKNITVGDLPFAGRGDFYVSVGNATNPEMFTSVAEEKLPKVVHFPEIITLKLRASPLEGRICIKVRELNVFGSQDVCVCYLGAMNVLHWAWSNENMKRFEMKTLDQAFEHETPPWILVEFGEAAEPRQIDLIRDYETVTTATKQGDTWTTTQMDMAEYKQHSPLLDPTGHAIDEPLEEDLRQIARMQSCAVWSFHFCNVWTFIVVLAYGAFRLYVWSCYRRFVWLTEARLYNVNATTPIKFPLSFHQMETIGSQCAEEVEGTGERGVPCRPSSAQVRVICDEPKNGGTFFQTTQQPWPMAFAGTDWIESVTGGRTGLPCFQGLCEVRDFIAKYEVEFIALCVLVVMSNIILRCACNSCIRSKRSELQRMRQEQSKMFRKNRQEQEQSRGGIRFW
eukprot:TRINITY_DN43928_c0_g1_i1.p1 TRINITY_DN43928_c0_g1~~TRINITY_DN43928_c0_g1_i1.p1  ORF type:complete len:495 (-),score=69.39 TRINITY_DN43928_c0_g1_i1:44-1528(-)